MYQHEQAELRGAALQQGAINYPGNANTLKQTVVADAMIKELTTLVEKASMIYNRQSNLRDRIFGAPPTGPETVDKPVPVQQGFLHEANHKIQLLHSLTDKIIQNTTELERLA